MGRHGLLSFRAVATALPRLSTQNGKESGEMEFLLRFFDLKQAPFLDAPEDGFFYTNPAIRQIYRELINGLVERPGIAALTGEAGTGKTILLRRLCGEPRGSGHLFFGPRRAGLVFAHLLSVISEEMKIPARGREHPVG